MPEIPFFSGVLDKFNDYQDAVVEDKIKGHGLRAATNILSAGGRAPITGADPFSLLVRALGPDAKGAARATRSGLTGKDWVESAYKDSPWQNFASSAVLDPLNFVGAGLPTKALTMVPAGTKLAKALSVAEKVDMLPGRVTKPVLDLAGRGVGAGVRGIADFAAPHAADFAATHPNVAGGISNVMRGWREQALLSPGYHVRNATENILRPLLEGDNKTAWETTRGLFTGRNRFDEIDALHGFSKDPDILRAINQDPTGQGAGSVFSKINFSPAPQPKPPVRMPSPGPAAGVPDGTLVNHMSSDGLGKHYQGVVMTGDTVQLGDVGHFTNIGTPGTARTGPASGKIVDIFEDPASGRHLFGVEFTPGGKRYTVDPSKLQAHTPGPGWSIGTTTPAPNAAQRLGNAAAGKVAGAMDINRRVGTHVEGSARKAAIATEYERALAQGATPDDAKAGALKYADELFFNYGDAGPVDELGRNLFAFHKFGMHNIPAQLKSAGQRPGILNVPTAYYSASDDYNESRGLPSRFHGEMPIGNTGWHINPMNLWSVGQLVGGATKRSANDEEGTGIGQTADMAQNLGLGLNPFIDALLTVTGQHGRSFAPSFLRASQPVNGVLSAALGRPVDIEGGPKELLGNVQEGITGQRPFPYQEYLLNKRRAELKAFGGDPSQAGSDVGRNMALEGLAGFMGVPGLKQLTPEELQIRKNSELAKAYRLAGNQTAYRANPTARTYADLDPRDAMVRNWNKLSADERRRLLRDPEVRDQLLDNLAFQLHNTGDGKGKQNLAYLMGSGTRSR
jgi:hypothetical protein